MPMIIRCPNHIEGGVTNDHIMAFWDMMPTFAELTGTTRDIQTDGISFLPTLLGKGKQKEHEYLYWEFHEKEVDKLYVMAIGKACDCLLVVWRKQHLNFMTYPKIYMRIITLQSNIRRW